MSELSSQSDAPWNQPWPADELERVPACPICGSTERTVLHDELVDNVFFAAPGKWTLYGCKQCGGAHLDPRPTADSIHRAYANYYTHQEAAERDGYASLSVWRKLRRRMVNGYTNWRYSTKEQPASQLGVLTASAMPSLKKLLDRQYRHLPRLPKGGGRLLDVGCGDGSFLALASTCGWEVVGLDPDPQAVANAARQGLTVHEGGIEYFAGQTQLFDVITLSHVIEHVHDPIKVLETCHNLLKPDGQLWLETPNLESFGHRLFKKNWRGLESPRHLVLFNLESLSSALKTTGFTAPRNCECPSNCTGMFRASAAIERGQSPYLEMPIPWSLKLQVGSTVFAEKFVRSRREFLTVAVNKTHSNVSRRYENQS